MSAPAYKYAVKIMNMVHHSSMGDGWHVFVKSRSIEIVKEMKARKAIPPVRKKEGFWDSVIEIIKAQ